MKDLQRFLGLANYYRRFIPQFSAQVSPLTNLLKGKGKGTVPLSWTSEAQDTFEDIRSALCQNIILYVPLPNCPFHLYTDTSEWGLGVVLVLETSSGNNHSFELETVQIRAQLHHDQKGGPSHKMGHRPLQILSMGMLVHSCDRPRFVAVAELNEGHQPLADVLVLGAAPT